MALKHRADIDGLRAVAIVPVVLFHGGVGGFAGGFVGVDVFFVISGYLITSLIAGEMDRGRFSVVAFYERRIRRIFPALFAVLLVTTIAAIAILLAGDLADYAHSLVATTLFASNFLFWSEAGYFAAPAAGKPLLHTWSIAVEEQFYLCFPLVLVLLRRVPRARWPAVIAGLAVTSFALATIEVPAHASAAFFLPLARGWELLLGALAALGAFPQQSPRARGVLAWVGLAMIALPVVVFSDATPFPGPNALLPCAGTLLLLHTGAAGTRLSALLGWRPLAFVGLVSYSWYLWHWPMLVLLRHALGRELAGAEVAIAIVGSLVIAAASWRFVERPFRTRGSSRRLFAGAAAAMAVMLVAGLVLGRGTTPAANDADYRAGTCFLDEGQAADAWAGVARCLVDNHAPHTALLWGDSFAAHYVPGLATEPASVNFLQYTAYSCPPVFGVRVPWAPLCHDIDEHLRDQLDAKITTVILAARWERYWNKSVSAVQLQATINELASRGLRVIVVEQGPSFDFTSPAEYLARTGRDTARPHDSAAINRALQSLTGVTAFFDPNKALCPDGECPLRRDGRFLYWDAGHYASAGSRLAAHALAEVVR